MNTSSAVVITQAGESMPIPANHPVTETTAMISMIERAARDPSVDIEKMERLFQMQERMFERQAGAEFNAAMAAAQAEMPQVIRTAKNTQTNSKYATLEAMSEAAGPVIAKHGFALSFGTADCPTPEHCRVTCTVSHSGGHSRERYADIPIDAAGIKGMVNKTATHAFGSTMSYGRRYLTMLIFNIATRDDNDGNRPPPSSRTITVAQVKELEDLIEAVDAETTALIAYLHIKNPVINRLEDIPAEDFELVRARVEAKRTRKA